MFLFVRNFFLFATVLFIFLSMFFFYKTERRANLPAQCYTDFVKDIEKGNVEEVQMTGHTLQVTTPNGHVYVTVAPDTAAVLPRIESSSATTCGQQEPI